MIKKILIAVICFIPSLAFAETITLNVAGMTCPSCSRSIIKAFQALPEVSTVQADHKTATVVISTKENQTLDDAQLKKLIVEEGYSLDKIARS